MKKSELIEKAIVELGLNETDLKTLSKDDLEKLFVLDQSNVAVQDEVVPPPATETEEKEQEIKPYSKGWTEYVMSKFSPEELENNNPKADGLRRVAEELFGEFDTSTYVVEAPSIANQNRATVVVTIRFSNSGRSIDGAADVYAQNVDHRFAKYPVATAETRAEARALRKALRLVKVIAAEEIQNQNEETSEDTDKIHPSMINSLHIMAKRHGIDIDAVMSKLNLGEDVSNLTREQALTVSEEINNIAGISRQ